MLKQTLTICNKKGLHARAAAKLSSKVADYQSQVFVKYKEQTVAANSVIQLMLLAAPFGSEIELIIDGEDNQIALMGLSKLIQSGFEEN
jgi:phosphocarrier protein